jgi:DNA primase
VKYRGRQIDPVALWAEYVEFPPNLAIDEDEIYLPKVVCPNPTHDTLKRHFQINARDGLVHCFASCGISGTFQKAIAMIEGIDEREARKIILKHKRSSFPRKASVKKHGSPVPNAPFRSDLLRYETFLPQVALDYLEGRGITAEAISAWNLGWCPEEKRIVIPAKDDRGTLRFLVKRAVLPQQLPKYLYTEGFPKSSVLFGACQIDPGMVRSLGLILVEGSIDVIRFHQFGFSNTGGVLGTGISEQQRWIISRLRPPRIYLAFDKDSAGIYNIESAVRLFRKYPLFICRFPKGKFDPAELSRKEARITVEKAIPLALFVRRLEQKGIKLNFTRQKEGAKVGY